MAAAGGTGCPPAAAFFGVVLYTDRHAFSTKRRVRDLPRLRWEFSTVPRPLEASQGRGVGQALSHVQGPGQSRQAPQAEGRRHAGHREGRGQRLREGLHDRRREHPALLRTAGAPDGVFRRDERVLVPAGQAVFRQRSRWSGSHQDARVDRASGDQEHGDGRR